jgi:hypothetical protein
LTFLEYILTPEQYATKAKVIESLQRELQGQSSPLRQRLKDRVTDLFFRAVMGTILRVLFSLVYLKRATRGLQIGVGAAGAVLFCGIVWGLYG